MGILKANIKILAMAFKKTPIKGDVLTLGQQAVYCTVDEAREIISKTGIRPEELPAGFDNSNKITIWRGTKYQNNINTAALFRMFGADRVFTCDVSNYENPDFLIDLNEPIPDNLCNRFDLVFDGGTCEHVFDVYTLFQNLAKMLKPGGRLAVIVPASNYIDHGFYSFSPTLFFDFFSTNGFENFKCYLREGSPYFYEKPSVLWRYDYVGGEIPLSSAKGVELFFYAVKERSVDQFVKPIQTTYQRMSGWHGRSVSEWPSFDDRHVDHNDKGFLKQTQKKLKSNLHLILEYMPDFVISAVKNWRSRNTRYLGPI